VQNVLLPLFSDQRARDGHVQGEQVFGKEVGQIAIFGLIPDMFDGVEIGGICRKPLKLEPIRMGTRHRTSGAGMHVPTVPHQDGPTAQMTPEFPQKLQHLRRPDVLFVDGKEQPQTTPIGRDRHGADQGQPVVPVPRVRTRCLSLGRPGPPQQGPQQEPAFIENHEWAAGVAGLLLSAANLVSASARWLVRLGPDLSAQAFGESTATASLSMRFPRPAKNCTTARHQSRLARKERDFPRP